MNFRQSKVLVVDDIEENIDVLVSLLEDDYEIAVALDGSAALDLIENELPDLILLDIMMPVLDGYEVCRRLKANERTMNIPVIFLTALSQVQNEAKGLALGATDYIVKPFNPDIVKSRVRNHILLKEYQNNLEGLVKERTQQLEHTQHVIIKSMGTLAEYRDLETGEHIKRTQDYVRLLLEYLSKDERYKDGLTDDVIELIYKSSPLHDLGKIGVPDHILLKPGKLTDEEFEIMKKHTIYGKEAIEKVRKELGYDSFLIYVEEIAYTHHEKWDGSGYPRGLSGEEIPISGRIMALADVYDALVNKRIYKPAYSYDEARKIIIDSKGTHFDPTIVDAFLTLEEQFIDITIKNRDHRG